ncbi:MAG TPA: Stk1 family PASTA domain-containing Ser/Thr kinase, partial [Oscillospiraceae bacterium]|nr:Stk1 family PASTA domain-containing Ser/Thr kinase [Oscillospiraceae bacterium]
VKVLKNELAASEDFQRRFRNESKAIALLSHPNIVKIYDVGLSDKLQYLVMEFIDGLTLTEYMEKCGVMKWKDSIHFITQILRALQHAHDRGIVHRDIKPQNIMLLPDGTIKVMDFGIARFAREQGKTLSDKTIGSVHYISPEQARGESTDERSDIYSVGIMLYEMLTGEKPFVGDNPVSVALMHMQSGCKRPTSINPDIPEGLEDIIMHAMQKDPTSRYQSATLMLKDIDDFKQNPSIVFEYKYMTNPEESTRYFDVVDSSTKQKNYNNEDANDEEYEDYDEDDEYEDDDDEEERRSPLVPILAAVASVFVIVAAIVMFLVIKGAIGDSNTKQEVEMPKLVGMKYLDALAMYPNLNIVLETSAYSEFEKDIIFEQSIDEGRPVIEHVTEVKIRVSLGIDMVPITDVSGLTKEAAVLMIEGQGLQAKPTSTFSSEVAKGYVIETQPAANETVQPGTIVYIIVSMGPPDTSLIIPEVIGMKEKAAYDLLTDMGLYINVEKADSDKPAGEVIDQSVPEGSKLNLNDEITITVSTGKEATNSASIKMSIPTDSEGKYVFVSYVNAVQVEVSPIINVGLTGSSYTLNVEGTGKASVVVNAISQDTPGATERLYAKYEVDFSDLGPDGKATYSESYLDPSILMPVTTESSTSFTFDTDFTFPDFTGTTPSNPFDTTETTETTTTSTSFFE